MDNEINSNGIKISQNSFQVGTRKIFLHSAEVQYFRISPEDWEDRLTKIRALGINTISTSINWAFHEEHMGSFDLTSKEKDLDHFLHLCENKGFFIAIKIGPYINADVVNGGVPNWILKDHPKIIGLDEKFAPLNPKSLRQPPISLLSPTYLRFVEKYYQSLSKVLQRHLYPHGGLVLLQIDIDMGFKPFMSIFDSDYNPISIEFYKKFLKQKYKDIKSVNQLYSQNFLSFEHIEPPNSKSNEDAGNSQNDFKSRGEFLRNLDWMECKEQIIQEYLSTICYFLRKNGLYLPYYVSLPNLGSPVNAKGIFHAYKTKIFEGLSIDHEGLSDLKNLQYKFESEIDLIRNQMSLFRFIPHLQIGYPDKIVPPNHVHLLVRHLLGNGVKGLNYYLGVGGANPYGISSKNSLSSLKKSLGYKEGSFEIDDSGISYDYGAPIGMEGQKNPTYDVINQFKEYIQTNSQSILTSKVVYDDIAILYYGPYSRLRFDSSKLGYFTDFQKVNKKFLYQEYALLRKIGYKPIWIDLEHITIEDLSKNKIVVVKFSSFLNKTCINILKKYVEEGGTLISFYDIPRNDDNLSHEEALTDFYQASINKRENSKSIFLNGKKLNRFHLLHSLKLSNNHKTTRNDEEDNILACNNWSKPTKIFGIHRAIKKGHLYHFGFIPSLEDESIKMFKELILSKNVNRNTIYPDSLTVLRLKTVENEELVTVSNLTENKIEELEISFQNVLNNDNENTIQLKGMTIVPRSSTQWSINKKITTDVYVKVCTSEINKIQRRTYEEKIHYSVHGVHFRGSRNILEINLNKKPEKVFSSKKDITKRIFKPDNKLRVQFNEIESGDKVMYKIRAIYSDDLDLSIHLEKGDSKNIIVDFNMRKKNIFIDRSE